MSFPVLGPDLSHVEAFATTHWSVVLAAKDGDTSVAAAGLETLCRTYWYPLYAFLRREGRSPHDAQDLTQEFFVRLLRGDFLENIGPEKGKFRSFLLAALKHFLADAWDRAKAQKRGGGQTLISLDEDNAEELYLLEPNSGASAEQIYDRRWALTVLAKAFAQLREEFTDAGKSREFDQLKAFLSTPPNDGAYNAVAIQLEIAAESVAVKVHRLRQRYGELIRAEIAATVGTQEDIEEELRCLFDAVGR